MDMLVLEDEKRLGAQNLALQKVKVGVGEPDICAQPSRYGQGSSSPAGVPAPAAQSSWKPVSNADLQLRQT